MTMQAEFAANFAPLGAPPELTRLLAFQTEVSKFERYAKGFGLKADDKGGLRSWSPDPAFLAGLMPFAQATGGGSFYALWSDGSSKDASALPVVVFGDEGGVHVVARDVRGLLRLLGFDAEPMVDLEGVTYYKGKTAKPSRDHDAYVAWLVDLGLAPADDPAAEIATAKAGIGPAFEAWLGRFVER